MDYVNKFGSKDYFSNWKPLTDFGAGFGPQAGYFELVEIGNHCKKCGLVEGAVWLDRDF